MNIPFFNVSLFVISLFFVLNEGLSAQEAYPFVPVNSSEEISLTANISKSGLSSSLICIDASVIPSPGIKLENNSETFSAKTLLVIENKKNIRF